MRKVNLNMKENQKYEVIKKLVETDGNKDRASITLGCTRRHVNRMIAGYKAQGKGYFVHGNCGSTPAHALSDEIKRDIVDKYKTIYYDANFTHYSELLLKHESIKASPSVVRSILMAEDIVSPMATKKVKREIRSNLVKKAEASSSKNETNKIQELIVALDEAHPRRPRSAYFGEMIQMDASVHLWFGSEKTQLHIAVDDCTGAIVGAFFDKQETLKGYYNVLYQILSTHGIPYMFYTDRRTVFEYKQKKSSSIENDTFTQFGYACKQLGIDIKTTSVPQAKGRVERIFGTLQSRLPLELRLAGATTTEQANVFLNSYIKEYNSKFALPVDSTKSVFELQPSEEQINQILAVISNRKIDNGHCIKYNNQFYKPLNSNGLPVYFRKGTECLVIKAFDENLYCSIEESTYALSEVPKHEHKSRNFDYTKPAKRIEKCYVPPMTHPWKKESFLKFVKGQRHFDQPFEVISNSQAVFNSL